MVLSERLSFTRRDLLVGLLGASWVGCRKQAPVPEIQGGFVETAPARFGHRLRDKAALAPTETREVPLLILGGGIAGLSAGWWLRRHGTEDFRILELGESAGGTSAGGLRDGLEFPWGAHYLPTPGSSQPELIELLQEFGTAKQRSESGAIEYEETELCAAPKERVYFRGIWFEGLLPKAALSEDERGQIERFHREIDRWVGKRGSDDRRAFALPVAHSAEDPELRALDEISMAEWLDRHQFTSPRLRWLVDYACRDDFGFHPEQTSAWAGLHYFAARTDAPGQESAEFLTWPAGNGELVKRLVGAIGAERILGQQLVLSVAPDGDGRRAQVTVLDTKTEGVCRFIAGRVIYALPSFTRRYVLSGFENVPDYHPHYAPWLVANVHLADHPRSVGFPTAWDNVIYDSESLGYVVATHQLHVDRGPTVWTHYLPFADPDAAAARRKLESLSWSEASGAVVAELSRCHPDFSAHVRRVDLLKWGHGMVRPEVGSIFNPARIAAARPIGPVHFAHSDLSGMALFEEAFFHGTRAAREVALAVKA